MFFNYFSQSTLVVFTSAGSNGGSYAQALLFIHKRYVISFSKPLAENRSMKTKSFLYLLSFLSLSTFQVFSQVHIDKLIPSAEKEKVDYSQYVDTLYYDDSWAKEEDKIINLSDLPEGKYYAIWKDTREEAIEIKLKYIPVGKWWQPKHKHIILQYRGKDYSFQRFSQYYNDIPINMHLDFEKDSLIKQEDYPNGHAPASRYTDSFLKKKKSIHKLLKKHGDSLIVSFSNNAAPRYDIALQLKPDSSFQYFYERFGAWHNRSTYYNGFYDLQTYEGTWTVSNGDIQLQYNSKPHDSLWLYLPTGIIKIGKDIYTKANGFICRDAFFNINNDYKPRDLDNHHKEITDPLLLLNTAYNSVSDSLLKVFLEKWAQSSDSLLQNSQPDSSAMTDDVTEIITLFYNSNLTNTFIDQYLVSDEWKRTAYIIRPSSYHIKIWETENVFIHIDNMRRLRNYDEEQPTSEKLDNIFISLGSDTTKQLYLNGTHGKALEMFLKREPREKKGQQYLYYQCMSTYEIDFNDDNKYTFDFIATSTDEDRVKVYFLKDYLSFIHIHDGDSWYLETHPLIYSINFNKNKTQAIIRFRAEHTFAQASFIHNGEHWQMTGIRTTGYQ